MIQIVFQTLTVSFHIVLILSLSQFPRHDRVTCAQPATDIPRLTVDVTCLVTGQEQDHAGNLVGDAAASQRVELTDLGFGVARPRGVVHGRRHAGLDQAGTDGVTANRGAG